MKNIQHKLMIAVALAVVSSGCASAAQIRLSNGDVLNGDVVSHEGGKIRFASPVLGTIELDDSQATVVADTAGGEPVVAANAASDAKSGSEGGKHAGYRGW